MKPLSIPRTWHTTVAILPLVSCHERLDFCTYIRSSCKLPPVKHIQIILENVKGVLKYYNKPLSLPRTCKKMAVIVCVNIKCKSSNAHSRALGLVTRRHRKFPFLRHTYDYLKMATLEFTSLLLQLL